MADLNPFPPDVPNSSDELPSEGEHHGIITEITPINNGESYLVTFVLQELDSQGKPKFIWQEFSREDMLKLQAELNEPSQN